MKLRNNNVNRLTDFFYTLAQEADSPISRASLRTRLTNTVKELGVEGVSEFIHNVIKAPQKRKASPSVVGIKPNQETIIVNGVTYRKA